jgi:hypothetical protein
MARRTLNIPTNVERLVEEYRMEGESFSAAAARLIVEGAEALGGKSVPRYIASGTGPKDLGRKAEVYLRNLVTAR